MLHHFRYVLILASFFLLFSELRAQHSERILPNCPMDIIIALDFSASERAFIDEVQTVLYAITSRFELHPNSLKIGIVSFNRGAQLILPLTGDTDSLIQAIDELMIPMSVFATDIHAGIELANQEFRRASKASVQKFLVLVSDGDPHAHSRGFGFQQDLVSIEKLKYGDPTERVDPVHVFSLYSGEVYPSRNDFREYVRQESIRHMQKMSSNRESFFFFEDYPELVNLFEQISSCL